MQKSRVRLSLRYKLLFVLTTLPVISLTVYLFMATDLFQKDKVAYVFDSSATVSRSLATQMRIELKAAAGNLTELAQHFDVNQHQFSAVGQDLFNRNAKIHAMILLKHELGGVYTPLGQMTKEARIAKNFAADAKIQEQLREIAMQNGVAVSESSLGNGTVNLAFRLGEKTAPEHHIVLALYQADDMIGAFDNSGSYSSIVLTRSGVLSVGAAEAVGSDLDLLKNVLKSKAGEGTAEVLFRDGMKYLISYSSVGLGELMVVSKVDKARALKAVEVLLYKSLLFFVALIALTLMMSVILSGQLTSTLRELFQATTKIAHGDFSVRVEPRSQDEVGGLAESFNFMAGEVSRLMLETAEKARMQSELNTVKTVQETLFPPAQTQFGPLRIKGHFEPASECGGDWWSYSLIGNKIYIWIGDATGHGAPAALITSAARSAAAVIESLPGIDPAQALTVLNRAIHQTSKGKIMMTFFIGMIDLDQKEFTYACASHDPPYLMKRKGEKISKKDLVPLNDVNGPRLGDQANFHYEQTTVPFEPGDQVFFYTDGIMDVEDLTGRPWGERAFLKTLIDCTNSEVSADAKIESMRRVLDQHRQGTVLVDDVTMVMCEFEAAADNKVAA